MNPYLTQDEREALLAKAIAAVQAYDAASSPETPAHERERLHDAASGAVTAAVVDAGYLHTHITPQVARSGLQIALLIRDPETQARALVVERNAAKNYEALVRSEILACAARSVGAYGDKTKVAGWLSTTRMTLDKWLAENTASQPV